MHNSHRAFALTWTWAADRGLQFRGRREKLYYPLRELHLEYGYK